MHETPDHPQDTIPTAAESAPSDTPTPETSAADHRLPIERKAEA